MLELLKKFYCINSRPLHTKFGKVKIRTYLFLPLGSILEVMDDPPTLIIVLVVAYSNVGFYHVM